MWVSAIVILGAGELGGAVARQLAAAEIVGRIVLVDEAASVAAGKALDIRQAAPVDGYATMLTGSADVSAVVGARAIVVADRHGAPSEEWGDEAGLALIRRVAGLNARAPIVCAGATQGTLVERSVAELGVAPARIFGSAAEALRSATIGLTALEAGCAPADISLGVLGRPPHHTVVPWAAASIAGHAATDVIEAHALVRLEARLARLWPPGPFTLGAAASRLIVAALTRSPRTVYALAVNAAGGHQQHAAMWPSKLGVSGIVRIVPPSLTPRDRVRLDAVLSV